MDQTDFHIDHIFISPGHNFVGHHGMEPDAHAMKRVDSVECVAGRGLVGDRFFDYKPDWKGQVTFFDMDVYRAVLDEFFGKGDEGSIEPSAFRRNVLTTGLDLNALIGREFSIGDVEFRGVEECSPCYWMDRACAPGVHGFLKGRGGLRARILSDGHMAAGPQKLAVIKTDRADTR